MEKGSGMALSLGTAMLLLRLLSKEDFAAWGLFMLVTYFVEMGRSGLIQNGLVRHLALHRHDSEAFDAIRRASLMLNLAFSVVSNLALWLAAGWISATWHAPQLLFLLPVYFVVNFILALFYHVNFVQQANHEFRGIFWANFILRAVLFGWIVVCWRAGISIDLFSLACASLVGAVAGTAASMLVLKRLNLPKPEGSVPFWKVVFWMKELARYGRWVLGTNLSTMFYKNIDKLTLGHLLGPAAFAVYDAAGKVTQLVEAPSFSIASVVFPKSAEKMQTEGTAGVKHLYERSVGAILAIILPFLAGVVLFARPVMLAFAGEAYLESADILRLTALFGLFLPFAVQFGTVLDSTGKPAINFAYTLFTAVLNLGLSFVFVQRFGLPGAALATLAGYALSFILMQAYLYRHYRINALRAFYHIPGFYGMGWDIVKRLLRKGEH